MGEVKTKVRLVNSTDYTLSKRGVLPVENVRVVEIEALVDTGAVNCVLPPFVADQLGLMRLYRQVAQYANGAQEEVDVTEPILIEIQGRKTAEDCLVLGDEVLIGQTALEKMDLHVDCRNKRVIPNPDHPNQPVVRIRSLSH